MPFQIVCGDWSNPSLCSYVLESRGERGRTFNLSLYAMRIGTSNSMVREQDIAGLQMRDCSVDLAFYRPVPSQATYGAGF